MEETFYLTNRTKLEDLLKQSEIPQHLPEMGVNRTMRNSIQYKQDGSPKSSIKEETGEREQASVMTFNKETPENEGQRDGKCMLDNYSNYKSKS